MQKYYIISPGLLDDTFTIVYDTLKKSFLFAKNRDDVWKQSGIDGINLSFINNMDILVDSKVKDKEKAKHIKVQAVMSYFTELSEIEKLSENTIYTENDMVNVSSKEQLLLKKSFIKGLLKTLGIDKRNLKDKVFLDREGNKVEILVDKNGEIIGMGKV